ncbi:MAG: DUF2058 domain-containing protein [Steroidobacteraceae bacterium]|jgi:hypothetical protein|nr:DUF2058 domain-containing protein [Steroidobacteraceae bacterium]
MSMSLRDQLLAAGLGTRQQAKKARDEENRNRHRQQHQQGRPQAGGPSTGGRPPPPRVDAAKLARDQELERKKREKAERKERAAQVKQLVDQHALPRLETDDFYNFVHDGRIARVAVDAARRAALVAGTLAIVRTHGQYFVVPADLLPRIRERDGRAVASHHEPSAAGSATAAAETAADPDDPYAKYKVPDDLMW